jgi:protein transport protein SEC61 subunit alpha
LTWTAVTLYIYLICSQIPLYGAAQNSTTDPLYWVRVILASNRGTLMELGISPLVTSSMIMQFFVGAKLISINPNIPEDKELLSTAEKLFGILMTIGQAVAYVLSGMYGPVWEIGIINSSLLVLQLIVAGVIVLLLDEMLQKGYGLGSGISLFIATNICENIVWRALSPVTIKSDQGTQFEGALISLFHLLATKRNKYDALYQAFYRQDAPNVTNLLGTIIVILIVIYFQGFKVHMTLLHRKIRGVTYPYTVKLFYTSTFPIILQAAFISNIYFFSQILHRRFKGNWFIELLGKWKEIDFGARSVPIGGLAYYMSPPKDFTHFIGDPFHGIFYTVFV